MSQSTWQPWRHEHVDWEFGWNEWNEFRITLARVTQPNRRTPAPARVLEIGIYHLNGQHVDTLVVEYLPALTLMEHAPAAEQRVEGWWAETVACRLRGGAPINAGFTTDPFHGTIDLVAASE